MSFLKSTCIVFFTLGFAGQATAEINGVPFEAVIQAESYARSIGCFSSEPELDQDYLPTPLAAVLYGSDKDGANSIDFEAEFLVFVVADPGCAGGTGTSNFVPVAVRKGPLSSAYYVDPQYSAPAITMSGVNLGGIQSVIAIDSNTIELTWAEWGPNDPNCCPSIEGKATLKRDSSGNWTE